MLALHSESHWLKEILANPLSLSTVSGIAFNLAGSELPMIVGATLELLAQTSLPLWLRAVGAGLRLQGLQSHSGALQYGVAEKLLVLPAIAWGECGSYAGSCEVIGHWPARFANAPSCSL